MSTASEKTGTRRWQVAGAVAFVLLPPLLFFLGAVGQAVVTYTGTCPGLMDILPYPCSLLEYIWRHTFSPFALAGHVMITVLWVGFALAVLLVVALAWWVVRARTS